MFNLYSIYIVSFRRYMGDFLVKQYKLYLLLLLVVVIQAVKMVVRLVCVIPRVDDYTCLYVYYFMWWLTVVVVMTT